MELFNWKLMRVAGEINTRKNIYIKKLFQRSFVLLYLVRKRNVYMFVRLILNISSRLLSRPLSPGRFQKYDKYTVRAKEKMPLVS